MQGNRRLRAPKRPEAAADALAEAVGGGWRGGIGDLGLLRNLCCVGIVWNKSK